MINNHLQTHVLRVKVNIKKLQLKVRFPCTVSFQLKHQLAYSQTPRTFPLLQNTAIINDSVEIQIQAGFNSLINRYDSRKVQLMVYMTSSNGKVIAGSVRFQVFQKSIGLINEHNLQLQKCPDKAARIMFNHSVEQIEKKDNLSGNRNKFKKSAYSYICDLKHLSPKTNFTKNHVDSPSKTAYMVDNINNRGVLERLNFQRSKGAISINEDNMRNYGTFSERYSHNPLQRLSQLQTETVGGQRNNRNEYGNKGYVQNNNEYLQNISQGRNRLANMSNTKYGLTNTKNINKSIRQGKINRLRTEISFRQKEQMDNYDKRIEKYKGEIQTLTENIEEYKQKIREYQKREKSSQLMLRELREQIQKRKGKQTQGNTKITSTQSLLINKEKQIKKLTQENKNLQELIETQQMRQKMEEKKWELRKCSMQQQIAKLQDKLKEAQNTKNQSINGHNTLLNQMQEGEKKQQIFSRERQKQWNEQKSKLNKKIESMNMKVLQLTNRLEQSEQIINSINMQKKTLLKDIKNKQSVINGLQNEKYQLIDRTKRQQQKQEQLLSKTQQLKQKDTKNSRQLKKIKEIQQQLIIERENNKKNQKLSITLGENIKGLQQRIKILTKQNQTYTTRQIELKRQIQQRDNIINKSQKQKNKLFSQLSNVQKINTQLKTRLQLSIRQGEEFRVQFQDRLSKELRDKMGLQSEVTEWKWLMERQRQRVEMLTQRVQVFNEDSLVINAQLIEKTQQIKRTQQHSHQLTQQLQNIKQQKHIHQQTIKQLKLTVNQKQDIIYKLTKVNDQNQHTITTLKDKLQYIEDMYKKDAQKQINKNKHKQEVMEQKLSQVQLLQRKIRQMGEQIKKIQRELLFRKRQIQEYQHTNQLLKAQKESKQQKLIENKILIAQLELLLVEKQNIIKQHSYSIQSHLTTINKLISEHNAYKQSLTESFQHLLTEISKEQEDQYKISLKGLVDNKITQTQVGIVQRWNSMRLSYKQKVYLLQQEIQMNKYQVNKLKNNIKQNQQEYQSILIKQREKYKVLYGKMIQQQQQYIQGNKVFQKQLLDRKQQYQRLWKQNEQNKDIREEYRVRLQQVIRELQNSRIEGIELQRKISEMKSLYMREKVYNQNKHEQQISDYEQTIMRLKEEVQEKQGQFIEIQRLLQEKVAVIRQLERVIQEERQEKEQYIQQNDRQRERSKHLLNEKQLLFKQCKQINNQCYRLTNQLNQLKEQIDKQRQSNQQDITKIHQLQTQLMHRNIKQQQLQQQYQQQVNKNKQFVIIKNKQKQRTNKLSLKQYLQEINILKDKQIKTKTQLQLKLYTIKQLQQNINKLKQQLSNTNTNNTKLKQQLITKQQTIHKNKTTIQDKDTLIKQINQQNIELQNIINNKNNQIQSLNNINKKNIYLKEQLETLNKQLQTLKQENKNIKQQKYQQNQKLKTELKTNKTQLNTIKSELNNVKAQLTQSKLKENQSKTKQQYLTKKYQELQNILKSNNYDLFQQRKNLSLINDKQKQCLYQKLSTIQTQKIQLEEQFMFQKQQMQQQIQSITEQYNEIVDKIKHLHQQNQKLKENNNKLQTNNKQLQTINKLQLQNVNRVEQQNEQINLIVTKLNRNIMSQKQQLTALKQQLSQCEKQIKQLKYKLQIKQSQKQTLQKQYINQLNSLKNTLNQHKHKLLLNPQQDQLTIQPLFKYLEQTLSQIHQQITNKL